MKERVVTLKEIMSSLSMILLVFITARKVSKYRVFSSLYFPVFKLNTEIYGVNLGIKSEYRKIQTRKNSALGLFSRSVLHIYIYIKIT